jgi:signal transduction histidine kinase
VAHILAVDDVPANLLALSAILEPLEARVITAASGPEAIEIATRREFAAILLDVAMPGMDGFETLERIRALPLAQQVPVILLTAYDLDLRAIERAYRLGAIDYFLKPITPELLRGKVAALVSLYRTAAEAQRRGAALAAKDRHIAMLAHDLQNPLSTILVSVHRIGRAELDPRTKASAERITRAVNRMSEMIRNLTDYARSGLGSFPIEPSRTDLGELCREVADDLAFEATERRIEVSCSGDLTGDWDRNRLHQALGNLLGNAMRYGSGDVALRATGADDVEIAVHNDGPPIPPDLLPKVFQPFQRGNSSSEGLGLGLYIVREIVMAHAGSAVVDSSPEAGTTFTLRLPRFTHATTRPASRAPAL